MALKYFLPCAFVICVSCNSIQMQGRLQACVGSGYLEADRITFENVDSGNVYSDKIVSLEGYFAYNFEDVALYSTLQPSKSGKDLWLNFSNELRQYENQIEDLRGKKVVVTGRLNYAKKGHLILTMEQWIVFFVFKSLKISYLLEWSPVRIDAPAPGGPHQGVSLAILV